MIPARFTSMHRRARGNRPSFTLIELMIVITLIGIMASAVLFALASVTENAKETRTRSQIAKLHSLLMAKWESYRTRALPLPVSTSGMDPKTAAAYRLNALRELMRLEVPERVTDLLDSPTFNSVRGVARWRSYRRIVMGVYNTPDLSTWDANLPDTWHDPANPARKWDMGYQGAECLYLVVSQLRDGDKNGLDFFSPSEIGDVDGDGMKEILDGWGRPIEFLRWAPGYATSPGPDGGWGIVGTDDDGDGIPDNDKEMGWPGSDDRSDLQSRVSDKHGAADADAEDPVDQFDPLNVDGQRTPDVGVPFKTYNLYPLIYSAGADGVYDICSEQPPPPSGNWVPLRYATAIPQNDPYLKISKDAYLMGRPADSAGTSAGGPDGVLGSYDNITNHELMDK